MHLGNLFTIEDQISTQEVEELIDALLFHLNGEESEAQIQAKPLSRYNIEQEINEGKVSLKITFPIECNEPKFKQHMKEETFIYIMGFTDCQFRRRNK